jgi:hypothetical protein
VSANWVLLRCHCNHGPEGGSTSTVAFLKNSRSVSSSSWPIIMHSTTTVFVACLLYVLHVCYLLQADSHSLHVRYLLHVLGLFLLPIDICKHCSILTKRWEKWNAQCKKGQKHEWTFMEDGPTRLLASRKGMDGQLLRLS